MANYGKHTVQYLGPFAVPFWKIQQNWTQGGTAAHTDTNQQEGTPEWV